MEAVCVVEADTEEEAIRGYDDHPRLGWLRRDSIVRTTAGQP